MVPRAYTRQKQQLGGAHGAGGDDYLLTRLHRGVLTVLRVQDAHCSLFVEKNLQSKRIRSRLITQLLVKTMNFFGWIKSNSDWWLVRDTLVVAFGFLPQNHVTHGHQHMRARATFVKLLQRLICCCNDQHRKRCTYAVITGAEINFCAANKISRELSRGGQEEGFTVTIFFMLFLQNQADDYSLGLPLDPPLNFHGNLFTV